MMKEKTFMLLLSPQIWKAPCGFLSGKLLQEKCFLGQNTSLEDNDLAAPLAALWAGKLQVDLSLSKAVHCPQCGGTQGHFTSVLFPTLHLVCLFALCLLQGRHR